MRSQLAQPVSNSLKIQNHRAWQFLGGAVIIGTPFWTVFFSSIYTLGAEFSELKAQTCGEPIHNDKKIDSVCFYCLFFGWKCVFCSLWQTLSKSFLTIQQKAGVWAPQFVDGNAGVVAIICVGHVEERQLGQWASVQYFHPVEPVEDPAGTTYKAGQDVQQRIVSLSDIPAPAGVAADERESIIMRSSRPIISLPSVILIPLKVSLWHGVGLALQHSPLAQSHSDVSALWHGGSI